MISVVFTYIYSNSIIYYFIYSGMIFSIIMRPLRPLLRTTRTLTFSSETLGKFKRIWGKNEGKKKKKKKKWVRREIKWNNVKC